MNLQLQARYRSCSSCSAPRLLRGSRGFPGRCCVSSRTRRAAPGPEGSSEGDTEREHQLCSVTSRGRRRPAVVWSDFKWNFHHDLTLICCRAWLLLLLHDLIWWWNNLWPLTCCCSVFDCLTWNRLTHFTHEDLKHGVFFISVKRQPSTNIIQCIHRYNNNSVYFTVYH